jgi:hypothetical protein
MNKNIIIGVVFSVLILAILAQTGVIVRYQLQDLPIERKSDNTLFSEMFDRMIELERRGYHNLKLQEGSITGTRDL